MLFRSVSQSRYFGSCKLLDLLGYGAMIGTGNTAKAAITQKYLGLDKVSDGVNPLVFATPQTVNILPLLTYQKIYFDSFSNSQWEKHLAYAYNVDYWTGDSPITLATDMLKLRYANYPKDYFMGMLPNSQYGSVAVLPSLHSLSDGPNKLLVSTFDSPPYYGFLQQNAGASNVTVSNLHPSSVRRATLNSDPSPLS